MLIAIIFLPLLTSVFVLFFGSLIGKRGALFFTSLSVFLASLVSLYHFYVIAILNQSEFIELQTWVWLNDWVLEWGFVFDGLSITMCSVVTLISTVVHLFSGSYMKDDPFFIRFMAYLSLFTACMLILITADNFVQMFAGWEGVGLCSFLLINFWTTRVQANKSALKAVIVNRVGDVAILLAVVLIFQNFKSIKFHTVFSLTPYFLNKTIVILNWEFKLLSVICFFLFIGSMAKSAQLFLHTWLPDAMEGPTPVSALIHAATMVTAGVFLILRCSFMFEYCPTVLIFISIMGSLTSLFGSVVALFQNDIKKIIAYSTCSQLGYMVTACGFSNYGGSLFHLASHAFFKALLFLLSGVIIHGLINEQDVRKMGGLINIFQLSYVMFFVASLSLMGFPYLSGFYSKDFILETILSRSDFLSFFCFILSLSASIFTSLYSVKLIYYVFITEPNGFRKVFQKMHDMTIWMFLPLFFLFLGTLFFGYLFKDMFIGLGSEFLKESIFILPEHSTLIDFEFLPNIYKLSPLLILIVLFYKLGWIYGYRKLNFNRFIDFMYFYRIFFIFLFWLCMYNWNIINLMLNPYYLLSSVIYQIPGWFFLVLSFIVVLSWFKLVLNKVYKILINTFKGCFGDWTLEESLIPKYLRTEKIVLWQRKLNIYGPWILSILIPILFFIPVFLIFVIYTSNLTLKFVYGWFFFIFTLIMLSFIAGVYNLYIWYCRCFINTKRYKHFWWKRIKWFGWYPKLAHLAPSQIYEFNRRRMFSGPDSEFNFFMDDWFFKKVNHYVACVRFTELPKRFKSYSNTNWLGFISMENQKFNFQNLIIESITRFVKIYKFFNRKFYFDYLYNFFIVKNAFFKSISNIFHITDKGFFELLGPSGFAHLIYYIWRFQKTAHTGFIYHYTNLFFLTIVCIGILLELLQ